LRGSFALLVLLAAACAPSLRAEEWLRITSGPFEVLTNAGERDGRTQLYDAEQFRYTLGRLLGVDDLSSPWPVRVVVLKRKEAERYAIPGAIAMSRDSWISVAAEENDMGAAWRQACGRILIDANTTHLPAEFERGLIAFLSTLEVNGPKLTWGAPPPAAERTRDWARIEYLATNPEYSSRIRVLVSNLAHGADYDSAYRNTFEKSRPAIEKEIDAYFAAGNFQAAPFSGQALSPRDFIARPVEDYDGRIALADLLLAAPARSADTESAYKALNGPEAQEGLGFVALRAKRPDAKTYFAAATQGGSKNARAWVEIGTREALIKAVELNPKWAEPHVRLAALEQDPGRKATELKRAANLDRRNVEVWKALALAATEANQFEEAAKAWAGAENAAATPEGRQAVRQSRLDFERRRADYEAAERKRIAEEKAREIQNLKDEAMADIHAAEAKARQQMNEKRGPMPTKVEQWWDDSAGANSKKISGLLEQVECLPSRQAVLLITGDDKTTVRLLVNQAEKIALSGAGKEAAFGCGVQKPARRLSVEYKPTPNTKLRTAGTVQVIEFQQ
jgi:hypothetical protein